MITLIADENIANIDDYLKDHPVRLIKLAGRDIHQDSIKKFGAQALFIRSVTPISYPSLGDSLNQLSFIGSATIGIDHVDTDLLTQHKIAFANAIGCSKHSVAQYVLAALLHLNPHWLSQPIRLGIIGLGNIGSTLAGYAKKLGWQVLGYDPFLGASQDNNSSLDQVLKADAISIHTPLTKSGPHPTYKMFDQHKISQLSAQAVLVNTARGEIIDEQALIASLQDQPRQFVLDVFPKEPKVSHKLMQNLTLATPHIAGYTLEGKLRGTDMIYQAFCRHFGLPIKQSLEDLLPPNPYHLDKLISGMSQQPDLLSQYYDINQDFSRLKDLDQDGVQADDFDFLRKTYPLRREWLTDRP